MANTSNFGFWVTEKLSVGGAFILAGPTI